MCEGERPKQLELPEHLKCELCDDLMEEPILIESGRTFDRFMIDQHFDKERKEAQRDNALRQPGDDYDESSFFSCPSTYDDVNPDVRLPNRRLKHAIEAFVAENPWAHEYDEGFDFMNIQM